MKPVCVLVSEDAYLLETRLAQIKAQVLEPGLSDFNFDSLSLKETDLGSILSICKTLPMMAQSRLVIVREGDSIPKDQVDNLLGYLQNPSPETVLVWITSKIDRRQKFWQAAIKLNVVEELKAPSQRELPAWISSEAKKRKLQLEPEACEVLAQALGVDLQGIVRSLEQIQIFVHPKTTVTAQDATQVVGGVTMQTVFDFTDAVGRGQLGRSLQILDRMQVAGEPLVRVHFMLVRHFRILKNAHAGLTQRLSEGEMAKTLGVHPFFVKDYVAQAKRISAKKLKQIYASLLELDLKLKGSALDSRLWMDRFIFQLAAV